MKTWLCCAALLSMTSLATLSASAKPSSVAQTPRTNSVEEFVAVGNEPFWNITIGKRGIVYSTPDTKPQTFPYVAPIAAQGRPIDTVRVYRLQGANNLLILKKTNACNDTMSDRQYPYSATLILGNTVRDGCADRKLAIKS